MKRFLLLAAVGLGALLAFQDSASARNYRYSRSRTIRPPSTRYQYNPLAAGSTSQNRLRPPAPTIPFQKPRWVDLGDYRSKSPANYGPGTGKTGREGERLYNHRVEYQGSSGGYTPGVVRPRTTSPPPTGGAPRQKKSFGYDESRKNQP